MKKDNSYCLQDNEIRLRSIDPRWACSGRRRSRFGLGHMGQSDSTRIPEYGNIRKSSKGYS